MICPRCNKNVVSVHIAEVKRFVAPGSPDNVVEEHHICEVCARDLKLPHAGLPKLPNLWKLLQVHTKKAQIKVQASGLRCPDCGMSLDELRRRGRVGCARDYEVFQAYLGELLERMHGSKEHVGRLPGIDEGELRHRQRMSDLKDALELAIRKEDYERAAALRDEISGLEAQGPSGVQSPPRPPSP